MPKFKVLKDFPYYHGGHHRVDFKSGDVIDTDDEEMIEVAISQGWATDGEEKPVKAHKPKQVKAKE